MHCEDKLIDEKAKIMIGNWTKSLCCKQAKRTIECRANYREIKWKHRRNNFENQHERWKILFMNIENAKKIIWKFELYTRHLIVIAIALSCINFQVYRRCHAITTEDYFLEMGVLMMIS